MKHNMNITTIHGNCRVIFSTYDAPNPNPNPNFHPRTPLPRYQSGGFFGYTESNSQWTEAYPESESTEICGVKSKPLLYISDTFCSSYNTPELPILNPDPLPLHPGSARLAFPRNMPVSSNYPPVDIPNVDLWSFLFEREDRPYPDDKSKMHTATNPL